MPSLECKYHTLTRTCIIITCCHFTEMSLARNVTRQPKGYKHKNVQKVLIFKLSVSFHHTYLHDEGWDEIDGRMLYLLKNFFNEENNVYVFCRFL